METHLLSPLHYTDHAIDFQSNSPALTPSAISISYLQRLARLQIYQLAKPNRRWADKVAHETFREKDFPVRVRLVIITRGWDKVQSYSEREHTVFLACWHSIKHSPLGLRKRAQHRIEPLESQDGSNEAREKLDTLQVTYKYSRGYDFRCINNFTGVFTLGAQA